MGDEKISLKNISMRDAFFMNLYEIAREDPHVMVLSADMGAPALDRFRRDFGNRFINVGIAEHNMIAVATGLANEGKKVYTYAIAPFITSRCHEFTKVDASLMKTPLTLIGVGAGFGYEDSGPTHHTTEDISIMRALPGLEILSPSDSVIAGKCARYTYNSQHPCYLRLERQKVPLIYGDDEDVNQGFAELRKGSDLAIVSTGNMVHRALDVASKVGNLDVGVIDLYRPKQISPEFVQALSQYKRVVSLEEHLLAGGLGSIVAEAICDNRLPTQLKRIGINDKYIYKYGRDALHRAAGIDEQSVIAAVQNF
ncbi:1-deoxy-D-xylulose-5-phosphate synthase [Candidatus Pacearchaeota archaeon]|nr:1-deoxy-D-xylulose-5-phosphate synthase [Candidatus Pacearchaeota archaeon]